MVATAVPSSHAGTHDAELNSEQLVDWIQSLNPSASTTYLMGFRREALSAYLDHLMLTLQPRGRTSAWVRRAETPAIVGGVCDDRD